MKGYPRILFVPMDFRRVNDKLRRFLSQMEHVKYASDFCRGTHGSTDTLIEWRNRCAEWFLKRSDLDYLCCIDDDVSPAESIFQLLDSDADVCGAHFAARTGSHGHGNDGDMSMAWHRISRLALGKMARPWYKFSYNAEYTATTRCECQWFCHQARDAGYHPVKLGSVFHLFPMGAEPDTDGDGKVRIKVAHTIPEVYLPGNVPQAGADPLAANKELLDKADKDC